MSDTFELVASPTHPSERRQHSRQQVRSIAYVELDEGNGGIVLNVSEGGLSVQAVVSLMDDQLPRMRIQLPQPQDWVETGARIAWTGKSRKVVGLEFVDLPEQARTQIREWVSRETLPAAPPPELDVPTGEAETEQRAVAPVGNDATVLLPEPPAAPAEKDREFDVSPREGAPAVSPVEQVEEPTPVAALAAPPPPELDEHTGEAETEQRGIAPVGDDVTVWPPESTAPAGGDRGPDVPPSEDASDVSPVKQAEEPTPVAALAVPPTPAATLSQTPPAVPVPESNPAARQTPPLAEPERPPARVQSHSSFAELRLSGRPPAVAVRAPKQISRRGALAGLVAALALLSLAAGWAAGRGAFDGVLARVHAVTSPKNRPAGNLDSSSAGPISAVAATPAPDTNNLRPVPPLSIAAPAPRQIPPRKVAAIQAPEQSRTWTPLTAENLLPALHRQQAGHASAVGEDDPPPVSVAPSSSGSILPSAGPADFPASVPRPPMEPQTRILKPAELIHRVDPVYPTIAREQRVQGTVKLRVTIAQDGTVLGVELLSGSQLLTRAAIDAVRQWRYRPTLINGKPVQTDSELSLVFRLP